LSDVPNLVFSKKAGVFAGHREAGLVHGLVFIGKSVEFRFIHASAAATLAYSGTRMVLAYRHAGLGRGIETHLTRASCGIAPEAWSCHGGYESSFG
jgi:TRAP-type C4-dicarboxylate transport system permease large subunit